MLCWRKTCKLDLFIKIEIFSVLLGKGWYLSVFFFFFFFCSIYYMISADIICLMEVIFYAVWIYSEHSVYEHNQNILGIYSGFIQWAFTAGHLYSSTLHYQNNIFTSTENTPGFSKIGHIRKFQVQLNSSNSSKAEQLPLEEDLKDKDRNFFDTCSPNANLCLWCVSSMKCPGGVVLLAGLGFSWALSSRDVDGTGCQPAAGGTAWSPVGTLQELMPPWGATTEQRGWELRWRTHWTHGNAAAGCYSNIWAFFPLL